MTTFYQVIEAFDAPQIPSCYFETLEEAESYRKQIGSILGYQETLHQLEDESDEQFWDRGGGQPYTVEDLISIVKCDISGPDKVQEILEAYKLRCSK
jgi:hypothetical protein